MNFSNLTNISEQAHIQAIDPDDFNTSNNLDGGRLYTKNGDTSEYLYYRTKKHIEYNLSTGGLSTGATIDKHGWMTTGDYYNGGAADIRTISGGTWTNYDNIITPTLGTLPTPYDVGMLDVGSGMFTLRGAAIGETVEVIMDLAITPSSSGTAVNSDIRLFVTNNAIQNFEVGQRLVDGSDGSQHVKQVRLLLPITPTMADQGLTSSFFIQFRSSILSQFEVRGLHLVIWK